jgi:large subunit ribosomal protein L14e
LVDSPDSSVPRRSFPLAHLNLTGIIISSLPRGARTGIVAKHWEKAGVTQKWSGSGMAQRISATGKRWQLNDFDRFKVLAMKKQRRFGIKKAVVNSEKAAAAEVRQN